MIDIVPVPYYYNSLDWERIVRDYPPPGSFFQTHFLYEPEQIRQLQEARLQDCLQHAWKAPFYRERWQAAGISDPREIKTVDDLRRLPIYVVDDIRQSIEKDPPFGTYQGLTFEDTKRVGPIRVHTSGGTTGRPRPTLYSMQDRAVGAIMRARAFYLAGFRPGDAVQNTLAYSTHNGGFIVDEALYHWLGCVPVSTSSGNVTRSVRQIELMRDWGVTGLVGFRDYVLTLAETAKEMGLDPVKDLKLKHISTMGGQQELVSQAWGGISALECYGMHEVQVMAAECPVRNGLHLWLDAFVIDIVDLETGEPVADGEIGSICVTALYKTGVPVVRYDTKDTTRVLSREKCACGSPLPRIDVILGRADTMVKLRGVNVWPEACGDLVRKDPRVSTEYFCYVERVDDRDEMTVMVERAPGVESGPGLAGELMNLLRTELSVSIKVTVHEPGALSQLTGFGVESKPRRFQDRRPKVR